MSTKYNEQDLKQMIEDKVLPNLAANRASFTLDSLILGTLKEINGSEYSQAYALDINHNDILIVSLFRLEKNKEANFEILNYEEIQGIRIKKKIPSYEITLQFKDGRNYNFELLKRATNEYPYQHNRIKAAIDILESKGLKDMDNKIHKRNVRNNRFMTAAYVITLFTFGFAFIIYFENLIKKSYFFVLLISIIAFIVHGILFFISTLFIHRFRNRSFMNEYMPIVKEYEVNGDARQLLEDLTNMQAKPKTVDANNMYYYSLSTALLKNNREKEALACLDKVDQSKDQMRTLVGEQRTLIEEKLEQNL